MSICNPNIVGRLTNACIEQNIGVNLSEVHYCYSVSQYNDTVASKLQFIRSQ